MRFRARRNTRYPTYTFKNKRGRYQTKRFRLSRLKRRRR